MKEGPHYGWKDFHLQFPLNSLSSLPETNIAEFANSVYHDEVAHHEPSHLDLHLLLFSL